jgi:hypothetical protein
VHINFVSLKLERGMKNFSEHPVWSTLEAEHKPSISLFESFHSSPYNVAARHLNMLTLCVTRKTRIRSISDHAAAYYVSAVGTHPDRRPHPHHDHNDRQ